MLKKLKPLVSYGVLFILLFCSISFTSMAAGKVPANTDNTKNKYYEAKANAGIAKYWKYWCQGASQYAAMRKAGCRMTAYSKMMVDMGIETDPDTFNPDRFYEWCKNNSYIDGEIGDSQILEKGGTDRLSHMSTGACAISYATYKGSTINGKKWKIAPTTVEEQEKVLSQMMSLLKHGCFLIIGNAAHYTYIDRDESLSRNDIYIDDSFAGSSYNPYTFSQLKNCDANIHQPLSKMTSLLAFSTEPISDEWLNDGGGSGSGSEDDGGSESGNEAPAVDKEYINAGYEYAVPDWYKDFDYTLDSKNKIITIKGYKGQKSKIIIGSKATIQGKTYKTMMAKDGEYNTSHFTLPNCVSTIMFERGVVFPADSSHLFHTLQKVKKIYARFVDTSKVTDISYMFNGDWELEQLDISNWDIHNVTNIKCAFAHCPKLKVLDVGKFNTSQVTDFSFCFIECREMESLDVSQWDTSKAVYLNSLFAGCKSLKSLDLSRWNTSNVEQMGCIFDKCTSLTSLNLSGWKTNKTYDMCNMFNDCHSLKKLDISHFDMSNVKKKGDANRLSYLSTYGGIDYMLLSCYNVNTIILPISFPSSEYGEPFSGSDYVGLNYKGTTNEWKSLNHYYFLKVVCLDGTINGNGNTEPNTPSGDSGNGSSNNNSGNNSNSGNSSNNNSQNSDNSNSNSSNSTGNNSSGINNTNGQGQNNQSSSEQQNTSVNSTVTDIPVTDVVFYGTFQVLNVGDTRTLYVSVGPANATNKTVTWECSDPNVLSITPDNLSASVTALNAGTAKIIARSASGVEASLEVKVNGNAQTLESQNVQTPSETQAKKPKAGKKKFTISWNVVDNCDGYEVQYSTSSSFKKAKTKTCTGMFTTKATIKKLKSGKKYYVRIRSYADSDGNRIYSEWSKKKKIKVK